MTQPDWERIQDLFLRAAELAPADRDPFLRAACAGRNDLRLRVEAMLTADDGADELLTSIVGHAAFDALSDGCSGELGRRIGPYVIHRELGRGGMGTVYLAFRNDDHFQQRVAIKVVGRGMDSHVILERFRQERQVLADLQHPHIARLLDGGATEDGLPYFAMEFLEGESITEYCRKKALPLRARLGLLLQVCGAVQYAHGSLVIHCDLKPENIIVTGDGTPKLLDFGIARLLGAAGESAGLDFLASTGYASPEQVRGEALSTATDVYSLGVVLKALAGGHSGGIASIVAKATAEQPQARYASAGHFADDIRLWLGGFPVSAEEAGACRRTVFFLRRHRIGALVTAAIVLSGMAGAAMYVHEARLAQRRFRDLHRLADSFVFEFDTKIRSLPGATRARALVVQKSLEYLGGLAAENGADQSLKSDVARAYRHIGDLQGDPLASNLGDSAGARASYGKSIALLESLRPDLGVRQDLARSYLQMASLERVAGNGDRSLEFLQKALPVAESAAADRQPENVALLAAVHAQFSRILLVRPDYQGYLEHGRRAMALYEAAARTNPEYRDGLAETHVILAQGMVRTGRIREALDQYRDNLAVQEAVVRERPANTDARRNLMLAWSHVGDTLGNPNLPNLGDAAGSLEAYRRMTEIAETLAASDPSDRKAQSDLATAHLRVGASLIAMHQPAASLGHLTKALRMTEELKLSDPANRRLLENEAFLRWKIASQLAVVGRASEAHRSYIQAVECARRAWNADPRNVQGRVVTLAVAEEYCQWLARGKHRTEARAVARDILSLADGLPWRGAPERIAVRRPQAYSILGDIYALLSDRTMARQYFRKSLEAWQELQRNGPLSPAYAPEIARTAESAR